MSACNSVDSECLASNQEVGGSNPSKRASMNANKQYELEVVTFYKKRRKMWITAKSKEHAISFAYGMSKDIDSLDDEQLYPEKEYDSVKFIKEYPADNKKR